MEEESTQKIRILYVITKSVWGGAGKYVYDLATHLDNTTYDVAVALGGAGELTKKLDNTHIQTFNVENFQKSINPFKEIGALFEILSILYEFRPHVVHANSSKAGGIAGMAVFLFGIFSSYNKPKTIFTVHGWAFLETLPRWQLWIRRTASRATAWLQDTIIVISQKDKAATFSYNITSPEKVTLIYNGIIPPVFITRDLARKEFNITPSDFVIGCVAEWTANKGIVHLLRAFRTVLYKFPKIKLILVGWGEDEQALREKVKNFGIDDSVIWASLSPVAPYIKAFDLFVLPSLKEGLPYSILEAGLAGLPVIATRVGGIPDIISNESNGLLVPPSSSEDLASTITRLILHPDERTHLARSLQEHVQNIFLFEPMLIKTSQLYQVRTVFSELTQE